MGIDFADKVAVITGAGAGLGRSYALFLASRGAKVLVNDLGTSWTGEGTNVTAAEKVVKDITAAGGEAVANHANVAEPEDAESIISDALEKFGSLDILINNAGILRDRSFAKMELSDFEQVMGVHLMGPVYCTKAAWPHMREKGYGRVVMTTSASGLFGNFGQSNYAAAKMGLIGFMNALALEGAKYNILVNAVAPLAATRLSATSGVFSEGAQRVLKPELVTPAAAFLASEACQVSGKILSAGGGYFSLVEVMEGAGLRLDGASGVTPDTIAESWETISDMSRARTHHDLASQIKASLGDVLKG